MDEGCVIWSVDIERSREGEASEDMNVGRVVAPVNVRLLAEEAAKDGPLMVCKSTMVA